MILSHYYIINIIIEQYTYNSNIYVSVICLLLIVKS